MNSAYWVRETARLRSELEHATEKLHYERRVTAVRAEHERVADERGNWTWVPQDRAVMLADGTWTEIL
jgi:hypothetical protein